MQILQQKFFVTCIFLLLPAYMFANKAKNGKGNDLYNNITSVELNPGIFVKTDTLPHSTRATSLPQGLATTVSTDTLGGDTLALGKKSLLETEIEYSADDSIIMSLPGQQVFLRNNAYVKYGSIVLRAHYIELNLEKKEAFAYGIKDSTGTYVDIPEFKDANEEFKSKELKYNFETGKGLVTEIVTEREGGYIHSEITKKIDEKTFFLRRGKYTTCDLDNPHFYIKMTKAKMIKGDKIVAGPSYLVLAEVPLPVGLPFGFFPFKKTFSSGIIIPSYGEEQRRGFNLRDGGYYWAINDYMDLAVTGDIFSNGSWGLMTRSTYKKRYRFSGNLNAEYHLNQFGDKGLPDYVKTKDFAVRWTHTQDAKANPYRTFSASVNFSTTANDRNNARTLDRIVNNQKQSSISYTKRWPDSPFSLSATLRHSQNSRDSSITLSIPDLNFNMTQIYPLRKKGKSGRLTWYDKMGITYNAKLKNTITTKEKELFSSSLSKDWRNGFQHRVPISTSIKLAKDLTFTPSFNYEGVAYTNSVRKSWDTTANEGVGGVVTDTIQGFRYAHNYSASTSLTLNPKIYGMYVFKETSRLAAIRHVITPSVSISYTPKLGVRRDKYFKTFVNTATDQEVEYSIFERGVFGTPTGAMESGSINFSLDNNLEAKVRTADTTGSEELKKIKILESVKFTTSYNIFADSLNWSLIRMTGRTKLFNQKVNLTFGADMDPYAINNAGQRIDRFKGRLTRANVKLGFRLSSNDLKKKQNGNEKKTPDNDYVNFNIPWSFNVDYGWTYTKPTQKSTVTQTARLNGDFSLTPKWKFNFSTGYDFSEKEITSTQFGIQRDLHCWQMSFNAIPFGTFQQFNFLINVKSSILKDLKYEKHHAWQDN